MTDSLLPNSYNPELNTGELIKKRIENHEKRITKKNSNNKILYQVFKLLGTITSVRLANDGAVVSYEIATDRGYNTTRHRRFLRPLAAEHDPKIIKQNNKNV